MPQQSPHGRADVPGCGGYSRFELELEVRICLPRRPRSTNTLPVRPGPREPRLPQQPGPAKVPRQARVRRLARLSAVLPAAQVGKVPTVRPAA